MTTNGDGGDGHKHLWEFRWVRDLMILSVLGLMLVLMYMSRAILIPVLIGLVLAYIFNPVVTWANVKLKISRTLATSLLLLGLLVGAGGLLLYFGPLAVRQASSLLDTSFRYVNKISAEVPEVAQFRDSVMRAFKAKTRVPADWHEQGSWILQEPPGQAQTQPDSLARDGQADFNGPKEVPGAAAKPRETQPQETQPAETRPGDTQPTTAISGTELITVASKVNWPVVFSVLLGSLSLGVNVLGFTIGVVGYAMLAIALIAFCFFTFSCNFQKVIDTVALYVPTAYQPETFRIAKKMDLTIAAIIRGRLIQSAALMVMLSFGWCMAGVPYWLLLGVVAGALNILPYAASLGLPAAILAVWVNRSGGGMSFDVMAIFVWPSVVYGVAQMIDGWVIETWVQGKATNLSPLGVLLAVLIGASIAGVAGMLLAIPTAACLKIVFEEFVEPRLMVYLHRQGGEKVVTEAGKLAGKGKKK
jgi:predicted PurR-regulated permease PerM